MDIRALRLHQRSDLRKISFRDGFFINEFLRQQAWGTHLVTLVVIGEKLWHPIDFCEDFNKQLGLVCRENYANMSLLRVN